MPEIGGGHPVEQTVGGGAVGDLIASQPEGERPTARIVQGMEFGGSPTSGPPDGLGPLPPLPPLAGRWACTAVESIITWADGSPAAAKAWKMASQTPLAAQRTKRLSSVLRGP